MCGVVGWVDWERDLRHERATLQRMTDTLAPRGPDAQGLWLSPRAALGHRRLAVIDLEGGVQPMQRRDAGQAGTGQAGGCVLTYAGELYNFRELRTELAALGRRFETRSDTEVLLQAWLQWGAAAVERFDGMFAFGLWDARREELVLVRDRLGIKPLFYAVRGSAVLFASEPKALLAHPFVTAEVDEEGLAEIFAVTLGRTPGHALFRGIHELKPGHLLRCTARGLVPHRYWQLHSRPHEHDLATTVAQVRDRVREAVHAQLVADVPVCTLLSGGLDSSGVTALAQQALQQQGRGPVCTYSVDFAGSDTHFAPSPAHVDRDTPWAHQVVEALGTRHRDVVLDLAELEQHWRAPMLARDQPVTGDVDISLHLLCRRIRETHTVALTGEGADELFGGYPWFHADAMLQRAAFPFPRTQTERFLDDGWQERLRPQAYLADRYAAARAEVPSLPGELPAARRRREMFHFNRTQFLHFLLERKDRISMASGLEVRVPFCDHRLVEYAWNIPWEMMSVDGREKGLLRRALAGLLPPVVLARRKSAYPVNEHPAWLAVVRARLEALLEDRHAPLLALVDAGRVRASLRGEGPAQAATGYGSLGRAWAHLVSINDWLVHYRVRLP